MVTAWCTRASSPHSAHQRRTASPPMLCATITGGRRCNAPTLRRPFQAGNVVVDGAEHRLQVDGNEWHPLGPQPSQPRVPHAPVADEAVHEQQAAPALCRRRQMIRPALAAKGLAPTEGPRRGAYLAPPGPQQLPGGGDRRRVVAMGPVEQRELQRQHERVATDDDCHARHCPGGMAGTPADPGPQRPGEQRAERGAPLQPGQHRRSDQGHAAAAQLARQAAGQHVHQPVDR